ncbi:MAG TPA: efflux RND transporter permease subunit [Verrucomicrobiae bacterium]|nr:efflux RND transporter permease subunit [Verrucomicrobiae bacterium]
MIRWLVENSLHARVAVVVAAAVLLLTGVRQVRHAPLDVFPEFAPPRVEIQTEAPGLSTEEVENLVTLPIENAMSGVAGVTVLRSKSVLGLSSVLMLFEEGNDFMRARQLVQERLAAVAPRLPTVARAPHILPPLSSLSRALKIGVSSTTLDQMELTDLMLWTVRPRLMAVRGVANVAIWGQRDRQLQVLVDPDRLNAHDVTLDAVVRAARDATAIGAGGFIDTPNQRMAVRHVAPVLTPADLARTVVDYRDGFPLRLGDVARVVVGHPPPIGDAIINDGPGLLLIVEKYPWGNTLDVTREVERALDALGPGLNGVEFDSTIFRPATFIELSIHNLGRTMLLGCLMVIVVLCAFLFDWRAAFISLLAIPLSVVAAAAVLHWHGYTLNVMVLAGLVIAVGEVVDDAIIDVENIRRRLQLNRRLGAPRRAFDVVLDASLEVRSAVVFASLVVVMVFLPVFFLPGLAGTFFRPLALSYMAAIGASLLVALTVTPALCLMLLPTEHPVRQESPLAAWLKARYRGILPFIVRRPRAAVMFLAAAFAATAAAWPLLAEQFLPDFKERDFLMHWVEKPGTSIEAMNRITVQASRELRSIPGVRNLGSHIGRAEVADEVVGPNFTELWISVDPSVDYRKTLARIQEVVAGYPGLYRDVQTYLKERIKEVLTGASATIVVRIFGPELDVLRTKAQEVAAAIAGVPGVADLKVEPQSLVPQVQVRPRLEAAANLGLGPAQARQAAVTLVKGTKVGEVYETSRIYDVAVWGEPRLRTDLHALSAIPIETPAGAPVPLGAVADVAIVPTPNEIKRENASRRIDVTCNVSARDLGAVAREVERRVRALSFDRGYHPEFLGEYAARQESQRRLLALTGLALLGILVLLHLDFRSWRLTLLVALTLPFALIGGMAAAFLGGGVLSLGSLVGFVTVLGIAARNGIMLVSHYRHIQDKEGEPFGETLVLRGAEERLSPILMTASCAALALLPLVVAGDIPGHEIEYPMAWVILGGLVTSTALNLFLLPALYLRFANPGEQKGTVQQPAS